jgi:hypothetical protein
LRRCIRAAALIAGLAALTPQSFAADGDPRTLVTMPAPMVQHLLANMREHLAAITEIQQALGKGEFQRAADIAEKRIGLSSLDAHGASHMAPFMPKPMQEIGTQMHRAASRFAVVAQEAGADANAMRAIGALAEVTQQCVACHAAFRAH